MIIDSVDADQSVLIFRAQENARPVKVGRFFMSDPRAPSPQPSPGGRGGRLGDAAVLYRPESEALNP